MKSLEFNIRYNAPEGGTVYLRYSLDDNGNVTHVTNSSMLTNEN